MTKTYIAICGTSTEFTFESEHHLHSAGNIADAEAASRRKYGRVLKIKQIQLVESQRDTCAIANPVSVPALSSEEEIVIRAAFADGRLSRLYMGAKVDGLTAFHDIKAAHGWSWNEFQRAVEHIH